MVQTLGSILKDAGDVPYIEYRTMLDDMDILSGICRYENGKLVPMDGDTYSPNDIISRYEWYDGRDGERCLSVWYESEWDFGNGKKWLCKSR